MNRPGVYEVPNGITLRELIDDHAGGMRGGRPLAAFAPSGPSGGFLPPRLSVATLPRGAKEKLPPGTTHVDVLDLELDLQRFRDLGLMLGAGLVVYAEGVDLVDSGGRLPGVLPQRIVRQVRSLPPRFAEARRDVPSAPRRRDGSGATASHGSALSAT